MYNKNNCKKAQAWYLDFMVGILILITILFFYYQFQGNISDDSESEWQEMIIDSKFISSSLISEGFPEDWTNETVEIIGLTDGNYRINIAKMEQFTSMNYTLAKEKLKTRFEFYFFLAGENGTVLYEAGLNATEPESLVQATRFVIYNSSVHRMVVHLWRAGN